MRVELRPHPDLPNPPPVSIECTVMRLGLSALSLMFRLKGDPATLRIPDFGPRTRADELWRHTCFEAFVKPTQGEAYYEFNCSPSGQWAAYRFDAYRQGMKDADNIVAVVARLHDDGLDLIATIPLDSLPELAGAWRLGVTAVIEAADGALSYWALAHPPGRPDFHHADCFALEVPAPQAT